MITAQEAIRTGRALLGTPYSELDCINYIKKIIRAAAGGEPSYTTAGTNSLWNSYGSAAKYRDLTWRQESLAGVRAGMLAFKRDGSDVHHVGLVTGEGTVLHSSSAKGCVVETNLYNGQWHLLAKHRCIAVSDTSSGASAENTKGETNNMEALYQAVVTTEKDPLRVREQPETGKILGHVPKGVTVDVLEDGDWPRVRYNGLVGYVSRAYIAKIGGEDKPANGAAVPAADGVVVPRALAQQLYTALGDALSAD